MNKYITYIENVIDDILLLECTNQSIINTALASVSQ